MTTVRLLVRLSFLPSATARARFPLQGSVRTSLWVPGLDSPTPAELQLDWPMYPETEYEFDIVAISFPALAPHLQPGEPFVIGPFPTVVGQGRILRVLPLD